MTGRYIISPGGKERFAKSQTIPTPAMLMEIYRRQNICHINEYVCRQSGLPGARKWQRQFWRYHKLAAAWWGNFLLAMTGYGPEDPHGTRQPGEKYRPGLLPILEGDDAT